MVAIKIKKGLDIPILGKPSGQVKPLKFSGQSRPGDFKTIALNLSEFEDLRFSLLVKVNDIVKIGDPLAEDRSTLGRAFVSPAAGTVIEIRRGLKRSLIDIIIEVAPQETIKKFEPLDPAKASQQEIIERWLLGGGFSRIRIRPFDLLAKPSPSPRSIFIKAVESLPFYPPAEFQVQGHETLFQAGINGLKRLTAGPIHLVSQQDSSFFKQFNNVVHHSVVGPHPSANVSLHIQEIDPILSASDVIWTLNAHDVVVLGSLLIKGEYFTERVIGIGGPACVPDQTGYFKTREGMPIEALIVGRLPHGDKTLRIISGDVLTGTKVDSDDYLGFNDYALVILQENNERELLHFFRLGTNKFTNSRGYLSSLFNRSKQLFDFNTNQHGEERPIMDSSQYDKVMPFDIPTVPLVKAVMAEDYDLAEQLGLLTVVPEDFALPTFVDPSKIEMDEIIKKGLKAHAKDVLH